MGLTVKKPKASTANKTKISSKGRIVILIAVLVVLGGIIFAIITSSNNKKQTEAEEPLRIAIDQAIMTCEIAAQTLKLGDDVTSALEQYKTDIKNEKDITKQADIALDMIAYMLPYSADAPDITDELNGAKNRISVALQNGG